MMTAAVYLPIAGLGLIMLVYKLFDLIRSPHQPAIWALWGGIMCFVVGFLSTTPGGMDPNIVWLFQHILWAATDYLILQFFHISVVNLSQSRKRGRWKNRAEKGALVVSACGTVTCWAGAMSTSQHPNFVVFDFAHDRWAFASVLCYLTTTALAFLFIGRLSWYWGKIADRPWIRRSLRWAAVGCAGGGVYALHKLVYSLLSAIGITPPWPETVESYPILVLVLGLFGGLTMPAWGPWMSRARRYPQHRRAYNDLAAVWRDLVGAYPEIELKMFESDRLPHTRLGAWWQRVVTRFLTNLHIEKALYRRVVEIWDGRSALRRWMRSDVIEAARAQAEQLRLEEVESLAATEGTAWRHALALHAQRSPVRDQSASYTPVQGENLARDVDFLRQVTRFYAHPLISPPEQSETVSAL